MALLLVGPSSQRLEASTAAVAAKPLTLACWFKPTTTTGTQYLLALLTAGTANRGFALGHITGTPFAFERGDALGQGNAGSALTAGTWGHVAGTFQSGTTGARTSYINGVAGTASTATVATPPTPDRTEVGAYNPSVAGTFANFASGVFAEVGIWNAALTAAELASLAKGFRPFQIRPSALVFFDPCDVNASPNRDIRGGLQLAWTGTPTLAPHPPILGQAGKVWVPPIATLGGTIAATSTVAGTLTKTAPMAGTIAASSTLAGTLSVSSFAGTLSVSSTVTAALTVTDRLVGTVTGLATLTGAIAARATCTGLLTATTAMTATLSVSRLRSDTVRMVLEDEPATGMTQSDTPATLDMIMG